MVVEKFVDEEGHEVILFAGRIETEGEGEWIVVEDYTKDPMPAKRFREKEDAIAYRVDNATDPRKDKMIFVGIPAPEGREYGLVGFIEELGFGYYRVPKVLVPVEEGDKTEDIIEKGVEVAAALAARLFDIKVSKKAEVALFDYILSEPGTLRRFYDFFALFDRLSNTSREKLEKATEMLEAGEDPHSVLDRLFFGGL